MAVKAKVLIYDIETSPLWARIWRLGDQTVRHGQLVPVGDSYGIISIAYAWNDGSPIKVLSWDMETGSTGGLIEEFDKIIRQADVSIGKNSERFDVKHINTQRLINNLPPLPEWINCTDDMERQMRRFFIFPSYSLDYFSKVFGFGGKVKMEWSDWEAIDNLRVINSIRNKERFRVPQLQAICQTLFKNDYTEIHRLGKQAFKKMLYYNKKDVSDTRRGWNKIAPHVRPKLNMNAIARAQGLDKLVCTVCGSDKIIKNGTKVQGNQIIQRYHCNAHGGYAGKTGATRKQLTP